MSSTDPTRAGGDDLPAALPSMWRALRRGFDAEPALLTVAFTLALLAALPDALLAVWLKLLADGLLGDDSTLVLIAAGGLAVSATLTWVLRVASDRTQRRFRDRVTIALESHVAALQAGVATVEHHERPAFLDRLAVLRNHVFVLDHMYMSLFTTGGWLLRLAVTIGLLVSIHPALALLALCALPTVATASWRPAVERAAEQRGAQAQRLARHLFDAATTAAPGKDVRVAGIGPRLVRDRRRAWERWYRPVAAARWASAGWHTLGWSVFGAGFVGAVVFVASGLRASPGEVLLLLAAGSRLAGYVSATVGEIGFLRGIWLDGSRRIAWLEDYAAAQAERADRPAPASIARGITLENVSFAYPGTDRLVLDSVDLSLPAGAVVALVGENGAGKTTLVKLLGKMYEPSAGRILVDGEDLARMPAAEWRARLAGAFQDFFRFELPAQRTVGVGDVPRLDERPAAGDRHRSGRGRGCRRRAGRRPRHPARSDLAGRRGGERRAVAEAGPRPRLHARRAAAARARRADRCPRRGDRARALRALRERRARQRTRRPAARRPHHPAGLAPVQHRAHGGPHRGPRRRPRRGDGQPRGVAGGGGTLRGAVRDPGRGVSIVRGPRARTVYGASGT